MGLWKQTKNNNLDILLTKSEFPFKNELDYKIKPVKPVFFFNNFSGVLYFVFWYYGQGSWRRYTFKGVFWCVKGEVGSFFGLGTNWIG